MLSESNCSRISVQVKKYLLIAPFLVACSTEPTSTEANSRAERASTYANAKYKDISDPTNKLSGKIETLELEYIVWGCACANWVNPADRIKYQAKGLKEHCVFIEPASTALELPLYFDPGRHFIKATGQFYVNPDYPKGTMELEEKLDKARVFRYTELTVLKRNLAYSPEEDTTLNLSYNAIGCTCAQWSDTATPSGPVRTFYFLEPANDKLLNADKLWEGTNIPLQIRVTGQIVSSSGYPTGYNPVKGNPEPERVFRYTKIKVIKNGSSANR